MQVYPAAFGASVEDVRECPEPCEQIDAAFRTSARMPAAGASDLPRVVNSAVLQDEQIYQSEEYQDLRSHHQNSPFIRLPTDILSCQNETIVTQIIIHVATISTKTRPGLCIRNKICLIGFSSPGHGDHASSLSNESLVISDLTFPVCSMLAGSNSRSFTCPLGTTRCSLPLLTM